MGDKDENIFSTLNEYIPNIPGTLIYGLLHPSFVVCTDGGRFAIQTPHPPSFYYWEVIGSH
jgi:hypothetical protein